MSFDFYKPIRIRLHGMNVPKKVCIGHGIKLGCVMHSKFGAPNGILAIGVDDTIRQGCCKLKCGQFSPRDILDTLNSSCKTCGESIRKVTGVQKVLSQFTSLHIMLGKVGLLQSMLRIGMWDVAGSNNCRLCICERVVVDVVVRWQNQEMLT